MIDDGEARLHVVAAATVDHDLAGERIAALVEDLGDDARPAGNRRRMHEGPELGILGFERAHALGVGAREDPVALQLLVLARQRRLGDEEVTGAGHEVGRQGRNLLEGEQDDRHAGADVLEIAEARVGDEQDDGKDEEERKPGGQARAAVEDRRRVGLHQSVGVCVLMRVPGPVVGRPAAAEREGPGTSERGRAAPGRS